MITLTKSGKRIALSTCDSLPSLRVKVPGAYCTVDGTWTIPLSLESLAVLYENYGVTAFTLATELRRWVAQQHEVRKYAGTLLEQKSVDLPTVRHKAPKLWKAIKRRPYQTVGAAFVADTRNCLVADEPGLGKTLEALAGVIEAEVPGPYLVVAPQTAIHSVWVREIHRWLPDPHIAYGMPMFRYQREKLLRHTPGKYTWWVINPEMLSTKIQIPCPVCGTLTLQRARVMGSLACGHEKPARVQRQYEHSYPALFDAVFGAVIIDESHESLVRRSGMATQRRCGIDNLRIADNGLRIAMSGTPCNSIPQQLWGTLNWLDPDTYSGYQRWLELYWDLGGYGGLQVTGFRKEREPMLWKSLTTVALRRTKAEVAKDLPPKIMHGTPLNPGNEASPVGVWLDMGPKQARAYTEMEQSTVAYLNRGKRLEAITPLELLTRLKQMACAFGTVDTLPSGKQKYRPILPSNKFEWLAAHLEEWGYPKDPVTGVVVVSFYTSILDTFRKELEKHFRAKNPITTMISGRTPTAERTQIIDAYNACRGPRIMFLNVRAGGTSITLDTADKMIFLSETRTPDQQLQAEDRIHRVSNPRQCEYYYLRSLGTVDVGTALVNREMANATHRLLDTRRGVEYVRHVISAS